MANSDLPECLVRQLQPDDLGTLSGWVRNTLNHNLFPCGSSDSIAGGQMVIAIA